MKKSIIIVFMTLILFYLSACNLTLVPSKEETVIETLPDEHVEPVNIEPFD